MVYDKMNILSIKKCIQLSFNEQHIIYFDSPFKNLHIVIY